MCVLFLVKLPQSRCARQPPLRWGLWRARKLYTLAGNCIAAAEAPLSLATLDRFPLLSPTVTSSPGAGEVGPQGDALWHCRKLYRHRQKPSPWGRWLRPKGADGRGLYPLLQKIAFSANLCLTTGRLFDIIEHVPAVRRRTNLSDHGPVAQLVRAPACHAGGRRFEPDPGRHLLL